MKITTCTAKEIFDSRGIPTLEVEISSGDIFARASVPSGKSTGSREAVSLRDSDGRGVSVAISNVNEVIAKEITGKDVDPNNVDRLMLDIDGTADKSSLGANAILGVSIATTKLAASIEGIPVWKYIAEKNKFTPKLPKLFMNIINGGAHSDFRLPFQEYMIVPEDESVSVAYSKAVDIIQSLGEKLKKDFGDTSTLVESVKDRHPKSMGGMSSSDIPMGDEGGYSPVLKTTEEPFEILTSLMPREGMFMAIDAAATELYKTAGSGGTASKYNLSDKVYSAEDLISVYKNLIKRFKLLCIEDPFEESDIESFSKLTKDIGEGILVVGDDLTVTNPSLITKMVENKSVNTVIIKPNQIGTLLEVYEAVAVVYSAGWKTIASHRSGETMDSFISDLAVGIGAYGIKAGSPLQKERKVKYDRLLEIEKELLN